MCDVLADNRRFVTVKSANGDFLVIPYERFNCKDIPSEPKIYIGDTWTAIDWYSIKFHNSLPEAWSRVEEETAERF